MNTFGHWIGPYQVLIQNNVEFVMAADGGNILYKDGTETEKFVMHDTPFGEKEYKEKFATYNPNDGKWYYKKKE